MLQAGHDASALRQAEIVRYHAMLRMLTERSILAGIEAARSDRALACFEAASFVEPLLLTFSRSMWVIYGNFSLSV